MCPWGQTARLGFQHKSSNSATDERMIKRAKEASMLKGGVGPKRDAWLAGCLLAVGWASSQYPAKESTNSSWVEQGRSIP